MRKLKRKSNSERWNPISIFEIKMLAFGLLFILAVLAPKFVSSQNKVVDNENKEIVPYYLQKPTERYTKPIDLGNGTAKYKGSLYPINVGPKGGRFLLVDGKKVYLSKTEKK
jgi:hypothetical protein